jgi:hypothetical protein
MLDVLQKVTAKRILEDRLQSAAAGDAAAAESGLLDAEQGDLRWWQKQLQRVG